MKFNSSGLDEIPLKIMNRNALQTIKEIEQDSRVRLLCSIKQKRKSIIPLLCWIDYFVCPLVLFVYLAIK